MSESPILRQVIKYIPRNICYLRKDGSTIICNYDYFDPYGFYDTFYDEPLNEPEEPPCQNCFLRAGRQEIVRETEDIVYTAWKGILVKEE